MITRRVQKEQQVIAMNRIQGLHTLALLDLDPTGEGVGGQVPMQPKDAANVMMMMAEKLEETVDEMPCEFLMEQMKVQACKEICLEISNLMVVLCSDMGTSEQNIVYLPLSELAKANTGRMQCIVIPASLGEVEHSALVRWGKE